MVTCRRNKFEITPGPRGVVRALALIAAISQYRVFSDEAFAASPPAAAADDPIANDNDPRVKAAVARAANVLRRDGTPGQVGSLSLAINALAKIRSKYPDLVPPDDPVLAEMVAALRDRCLPQFQPSLVGGHDNYEAGCAAMALAAVSRTEYAAELQSIANYLLEKQLANGAWSYDGAAAPGGDTSMTQYALLGLWEANNGGGGPIPKEAWDKAANWLVTRQTASGGFCYHPRDPGPGVVQPDPTHTMTVASLGSLYLCRDHLQGGRRRDNLGVLQPIEPKAPVDNYKPQVKPETIRNAIDSATKWLEQNFTLTKARGEGDSGGGRWLYYYLYAFERFATLADQKMIADVDWYSSATGHLLARQQANGSWSAGNGDVVDTSFAVLFLVRSTHITLKNTRESLLKRGTLVYPGNLEDLLNEVKQVRFKPVRGPNGQLIDIVLSRESDLGDEWLEGDCVFLVPTKFSAEDRHDILRRLLDKGYLAKDTVVIKTALRGLALTGDYRVVPRLIDAMYYDESPDVQRTARQSLCLISRRFEPKYTGTTDEEWQAEIDKWKAWYRKVRPQAEVEDDVPPE